MNIEDITKDKNLMRITWLALSLSSQINEDELLLALSSLLEDYFIKHDADWLDKWVEAAEECAETGDPNALLELMAEATTVGRMIAALEDEPKLKGSLN